MPVGMCLDGRLIARGIKQRARAANTTVRRICDEAGVSYRTYLSWSSYGLNPSIASLKKIEAVLVRHEQGALPK